MVTVKDVRDFAKYHLKRRVTDYPEPETTMGVELLGYDADSFASGLAAYGQRAFDVEVIERLTYLGRRYPMHRVCTQNRDARRRLLVLSGVHGNEEAGLLSVPRFLDTLAAHRTPEQVQVTIISPVNPVGAAHHSRYNGDGFDLNRDFHRFETVEARAVRREIDQQGPDFIVSLHEGPQDAAFMFANHHVEASTARRLLDRLQARGTELAEKDYFGRKLDIPGYAPSNRVTRALEALWLRTLGMRTTGGYAASLGIPEITLETSWKNADADARIDVHVALLEAVVEQLDA